MAAAAEKSLPGVQLIQMVDKVKSNNRDIAKIVETLKREVQNCESDIKSTQSDAATALEEARNDAEAALNDLTLRLQQEKEGQLADLSAKLNSVKEAKREADSEHTTAIERLVSVKDAEKKRALEEFDRTKEQEISSALEEARGKLDEAEVRITNLESEQKDLLEQISQNQQVVDNPNLAQTAQQAISTAEHEKNIRNTVDAAGDSDNKCTSLIESVNTALTKLEEIVGEQDDIIHSGKFWKNWDEAFTELKKMTKEEAVVVEEKKVGNQHFNVPFMITKTYMSENMTEEEKNNNFKNFTKTPTDLINAYFDKKNIKNKTTGESLDIKNIGFYRSLFQPTLSDVRKAVVSGSDEYRNLRVDGDLREGLLNEFIGENDANIKQAGGYNHNKQRRTQRRRRSLKSVKRMMNSKSRRRRSLKTRR